MSESSTLVVSIRLTPAVLAALKVRAAEHHLPVTRMGGVLIEEGLTRPRLAHAAPLAPVRDPSPPTFSHGRGAASGLPLAPAAVSLARTEVVPRFKAKAPKAAPKR